MQKALALITNTSFSSDVVFPYQLTKRVIIHKFFDGDYPHKAEVHDWVKNSDRHWGAYQFVLEIDSAFESTDTDNVMNSMKLLVGIIRLVNYNRSHLIHLLCFDTNRSDGPNPVMGNTDNYPIYFSGDELVSLDDLRIVSKIAANGMDYNRRIGRSLYYWLQSEHSIDYNASVVTLFTAFESLLTTDNSEVTYKMAHRFAWIYSALVHGDSRTKHELLDMVKKGYKIRSKIVHGASFLDANQVALVRLAHDSLRKLLLAIATQTEAVKSFEASDSELDNFFDSLVLGAEMFAAPQSRI